MKKRMLCWLLALVMVFSLLPTFGMNAAAASDNQTLDGTSIYVSWSTQGNNSNVTISGTTINASVYGGNNTTKITIRNDYTDDRVLSFDYSGKYENSTVTIAGTTVASSTYNGSRDYSGKYPPASSDGVLKSGESIDIVLSANKNKQTTINLTNIKLDPVGGETPTTPPSGNYEYHETDYKGLKVGDDIDLSQTYYVNVGTEANPDYREVTITKDTYYTAVADDGADHNDRVAKTQKSDGFYGDPSPLKGWTPITGAGMYYMKDDVGAAVHNTFLPVQAENGTLQYDAYSNKLIASKSSRPSDGMIVGPSESIGGWTTGTSDVIVVDEAGNEHTVLYANKGSTFHYNMFVYYKDGNDVVFLTQGANESDGDSKYFSSYPGSPKSDTPTGVGKYYYTYNNTLGSYGGKGYYTGTYYRVHSHDGKVALYYVDNGVTYWLSTSGVQTEENARTTAKHDHQVVYTCPLYQLETLQRATYFTYSGAAVDGQAQNVTSHLKGDVLTTLTLYTRELSGETPITLDDGIDGEMGTLVDTTNNFNGNLFIQKRLYRAADGTYNIKLESWATGDMTAGKAAGPSDIILVLDQSLSMDYTGNVTGVGSKRIERLKAALKDFVASIPTTTYQYSDTNETVPTYRIAMVGFAGQGTDYNNTGIIKDGTFKSKKNNTSDYITLKNNAFVDVTDTTRQVRETTVGGVTKNELTGGSFYNSINALSASGETYTKEGLVIAEEILDARQGKAATRKPIIIVFTDGQPGDGNANNDINANYALQEAYKLKNPDTYDATIYTIGLFGKETPDNLIRLYVTQSDLIEYQGGHEDDFYAYYPTDEAKLHLAEDYFTHSSVSDWSQNDGFVARTYLSIIQTGYETYDYYCHSKYTVHEFMSAMSSSLEPRTDSLEAYRDLYQTQKGYAAPPKHPVDAEHAGDPLYPDSEYYFTTDDSGDLSAIFSAISQDIVTTDVPVTTDSILKDMINTDDFALPVYDETKSTDTIQVNTVAAEAINSRKQIQWATTESAATGVTPHPITVTENGTTYLSGVTVSGFDYQKNFSAPNLSDLTKSTKGSKLVVRIKGLMPKHGGEVYSNSEAGILNEVKNEAGNGTGQYEMYLGVESPFDTIAKRSYVVDFNANMKVAENGYLVSNDETRTAYVNDIKTNTAADGQNNGSFSKSGKNDTIFYQLGLDTITDESGAEHKDYTFTGSDTALAFGAYYNNTARADGTKTGTVQVTLNKQVFDPYTGKESKVPDLADKAWQVVNMIPASSIYYDDNLKGTTAVIGDGSGYNVAVEVSPNETKSTKGLHSFAFTGTGIDIYCTTDNTAGYAQAKLDGEQVQTMLNYSVTTRYNVPTYSFRGLEYGKHLVQLNILNSSNYRLDGVRIYGPEDDQTIYVSPAPSPDATPAPAQSVDHTEQYAAYINLRQALVNDNTSLRVSESLNDDQMVNDPNDEGAASKPAVGILFVDDSTKLELQRQATGKDAEGNDVLYWEVNEDGSYRLDKDGNKIPRMVTVYKDEFEAYKENSPKQEIYLKAPEDKTPGQAIIFTLSDKAVAAAEHGNLWIGLSAPDQGAGSGEVTLKDQVGETPAKTITVTSGVDMYYPISSDMISNKVVTIKNTGSSMISVTNLKITGDPNIYAAAYADVTPTPVVTDDAQGHTNSVDDNAMASTLSVEDVISMVFEPVTMRTIKLAANNGVDPDLAVVEPEPTAEPEPSPTAEPEVTPDPTPAPTAAPTPVPTHTPNVHTIVKQLISNFVSSLFRSIARLFH